MKKIFILSALFASCVSSSAATNTNFMWGRDVTTNWVGTNFSKGIIFSTVFPSASNAITVTNLTSGGNVYTLVASGNVSVTNVIGSQSGKYMSASLMITNATAGNITVTVTAPTATPLGYSTTNVMTLGAAKRIKYAFETISNTQTNYACAPQNN